MTSFTRYIMDQRDPTIPQHDILFCNWFYVIQQNTDEGRILLETPVKCSRWQLCCCCCNLLLRFYGWAVMLLCLTVVGYRQSMLYCEGGPLRILDCHQVVLHYCIPLVRFYGWAVVMMFGVSTCI